MMTGMSEAERSVSNGRVPMMTGTAREHRHANSEGLVGVRDDIHLRHLPDRLPLLGGQRVPLEALPGLRPTDARRPSQHTATHRKEDGPHGTD